LIDPAGCNAKYLYAFQRLAQLAKVTVAVSVQATLFATDIAQSLFIYSLYILPEVTEVVVIQKKQPFAFCRSSLAVVLEVSEQFPDHSSHS